MERRDVIPDVHAIAQQVLEDLRNGGEYQGFDDAVGTLTGLTEDDLIAVVIELAERQVEPLAGPATSQR
jgi:hypothetical protein